MAPFFGTAPLTAPTLQVEIGVGQDGALKPYSDGDWVPITHGPQGGIHVWIGWRVNLPGHSKAKVKMLTHATVHIGCELAGMGAEVLWYATPEAGNPGTYTGVSQNHPGNPVVLPFIDGSTHAYCGQWAKLQVQVHEPGSKAWGEVRRTVRLYDPMAGGGN